MNTTHIEVSIGAYARHSIRAAASLAEARAGFASARATYDHPMPAAWVGDQLHAAMLAARSARDSAWIALRFAYAAEAAFGGKDRVEDCLRMEKAANGLMAGGAA